MIPGPDRAAESHLLFVYGTLRRGFELHHHLARLGARFRTEARVAAELIDRGRYPGARPAVRKGKWVRGELFQLRYPARDVRVLDEVEGFLPAAPARSEFVRAAAEVILNNGARQRAWIYWRGGAGPRGIHMDSLADRTQNVILETNRLRFATWSVEDWKAFQKIATDPLVVRYLGTGEPWPDERVQEFVARQCENWEKYRICLWKLLPKDSDTLMGICGLQHLPEGPDVEIGWWLAPSFWGQGLATEAARHALVYGFEVSNLERIVAIAQAANRDSLRVMERIGMRFEREAVHKGIRVVLYAIARAQFISRQREGEERA